MKKLTKAITAAAVSGVFALSAAAPVVAQSFGFSFGVGDRTRADRVFSRYCDRNYRDNDCRRYRQGRFSDRDYYNFYRRNRGGIDNIASGFFGFTLGTIFGAAAANARDRSDSSWSTHVARCEARFRSYDRRTDQYLGYDGDYHYCRL